MKFLKRHISNARGLLLGRKVQQPSFVSATLDRDDVEIAKSWLTRSDEWQQVELTEKYEKEFAIWNESEFAFAFMSGRESLFACLNAIDFVDGDEIIVPGYTCVVVPNAVKYLNLKPVYVDIELQTYGPSFESVVANTTEKTKAIIIQHSYGLICRDFERILKFAKEKDIPVIEDCTHATGARFKSRRIGNFGAMSFYSSERSKVFCTIQGGMATSNDAKFARRIADFQGSAKTPANELIRHQLKNVIQDFYKYKHPQRWLMRDVSRVLNGDKVVVTTTVEEKQGRRPSNYGRRMTDPIAAIGLNQLHKIDDYNSLRRENANKWHLWCEENGYEPPLVLEESEPTYLRYPVLVEQEKKSKPGWAAAELGLRLGVWFISNLHPIPSHLEQCPNANIAVRRCVNLPTLLF